MRHLLQIIDSDFCKKCKDCCRFHPECINFSPVFINKDKDYIINELGFNKNLFFKKKTDEWTVKFKKKQGKYLLCPFLKDERCAAQEIKPFNCLLYPVILMRSKDNKKIVVALDESCKAIKQNKILVPLGEYIENLKKYFKSEKIIKKIKELPSHVEPYQGEYKIIFEL